MMVADLHLHTNFSDGTYSPEELAAYGRQHGLAAMSLTDHDTIGGCDRMAAACQSLGIEFISGVENFLAMSTASLMLTMGGMSSRCSIS